MSKYEPTYWNEKGKHQKLYRSLFKKLVPQEGEANTISGEILRIVSKIYYDIYNNGACNFDVLRRDRLSLLTLVPTYAYAPTEAFIKEPNEKKLNNPAYRRLLDKYVDWAVLYADALLSIEKLEKELK